MHLLITEGLLSDKVTENDELITYPLVMVNYRYMNRLWRNRVLALLKNFKIIDDETVTLYKQKYQNGKDYCIRAHTRYAKIG